MNTTTVPTAQDVATTVRTMSRTGKLLFGGLAAAALASFLPWVTVTDSFGDQYDLTPSDLQLLAKILVFVATAAWAAWPAIAGTFSKKRCIGLTAAVSFVSLFPVVNFLQIMQTNSRGTDGDSVTSFGLDDTAKCSVALGLLVFGGAMVAVWFGVLRVWHGRRASRVAPTPPSFPPPQAPAVTSGM